MGTDTVTFRIDHATKTAAAKIVDDFGFDLSTALRMFLKQIVMRREVPLTLSYPDTDPFYSEANMASLRQGADEFDHHPERIIHKTMAELQDIA